MSFLPKGSQEGSWWYGRDYLPTILAPTFIFFFFTLFLFFIFMSLFHIFYLPLHFFIFLNPYCDYFIFFNFYFHENQIVISFAIFKWTEYYLMINFNFLKKIIRCYRWHFNEWKHIVFHTHNQIWFGKQNYNVCLSWLTIMIILLILRIRWNPCFNT